MLPAKDIEKKKMEPVIIKSTVAGIRRCSGRLVFVIVQPADVTLQCTGAMADTLVLGTRYRFTVIPDPGAGRGHITAATPSVKCELR